MIESVYMHERETALTNTAISVERLICAFAGVSLGSGSGAVPSFCLGSSSFIKFVRLLKLPTRPRFSAFGSF